MQKHKVWLSILFGLGVLIPVLFFTPVAALQDNPDQIQSNKTKRPTVDWDITATSVSTRESRFNSSSTSISPSPSSLIPLQPWNQPSFPVGRNVPLR